MSSRFPFKSALFVDESGHSAPLSQAEGDLDGTRQRPLKLHFLVRRNGPRHDATIATIELSRAEAYAFSEWLDAMVTRLPPSQ